MCSIKEEKVDFGHYLENELFFLDTICTHSDTHNILILVSQIVSNRSREIQINRSTVNSGFYLMNLYTVCKLDLDLDLDQVDLQSI